MAERASSQGEKLLEAIKSDDTESVRGLLLFNNPMAIFGQTGRAGRDILEMRDESENGRTPLLLAAQKSERGVVNLLLRHGAYPNAVDCDGKTALHLARDVEIATRLIRAGVDVKSRDDRGKTALDYAINEGNVDLSLALLSPPRHLKWYFSFSTVKNSFLPFASDLSPPPAHVDGGKRKEAVYSVMEHLLKTGAELEARDEDGNTPLMLAAMHSLPYMSRYLLEKNANVNAKNKDGATALLLASEHANRDIVDIVLEHAGPSQLEECDKRGFTPLLVAGNKEIAKQLVDEGANVEAVDNAGNNGLQIAVGKNNYSTAEYWLEKGANVSAKNSNNETAFAIALKKEHTGMMLLLDAYGEKVDTCGVRLSPFMKEFLGVMEPKVAVSRGVSEAELAKEDSATIFAKRERDSSIDINLLALDGGGIRGLALCEMLSMIERRRKSLYPGRESFLSNFNWMSGTSTGSLMVLGHVYKGFTAERGRSMYWSLKDRVFPGFWKRWWEGSGDLLTEVLQDVFGKEDTLAVKKEPKVVVPTTLCNQNPPRCHLMSNYGIGRDGQVGPHTRKVWEAARASSAAPFYFTPFNDFFLDGGLLANNPTPDAMSEMHLTHSGNKRIRCVISLGTGSFVKDVTDPMTTSLNVTRKETFLNPVAYKSALRVMLEAIVPAATSTDRNIHRAHYWCNSAGAAFFRFDPQLEEDVDLAETDEKKLTALLRVTQQYMVENRYRVDKLLETLYG